MSVRTWMAGWFVVVSLGVAGCASETVDASPDAVGVDSEALARSADCSLVRCALPECGPGQQLSYRGGCCPVCVGAPSRCAAVLCPAIACAEGEQLVTTPGDCCGRCAPARPVQQCDSDLDCPQYACITCPCPVSECRGNRCVTSTPDASTCNAQ
jgi:hypothetical protein